MRMCKQWATLLFLLMLALQSWFTHLYIDIKEWYPSMWLSICLQRQSEYNSLHTCLECVLYCRRIEDSLNWKDTETKQGNIETARLRVKICMMSLSCKQGAECLRIERKKKYHCALLRRSDWQDIERKPFSRGHSWYALGTLTLIQSKIMNND